MFRDIINTYRQAFRAYIRNRTIPVSYEEAEEKRLFWSKCYAVSAVVTFLYLTYITAKKNFNFAYRKDVDKDQAILEGIGAGESNVYKFKGFTKVAEFHYIPPPPEEEEEDGKSEKA